MALSISFAVTASSDQKSLIITDTTGEYSLGNPGGFGAPNPTRADIDVATLQLSIPNPSTYLISTNTVSLDLFADFSYPVDSPITITNVDLGLSSTATIPDGQYSAYVSMTSSVESGSVTSNSTVEFVLYYNAQCCIFQMTSALADCGCSSSEKQKKQTNIFKANLGLATINYSSCNISKAVENLVYAAELCAAEGCQGCGGC